MAKSKGYNIKLRAKKVSQILNEDIKKIEIDGSKKKPTSSKTESVRTSDVLGKMLSEFARRPDQARDAAPLVF